MSTGNLGSVGGRANEGGSAYRAGLAAYLAAHGLADTGVHAEDGSGADSPASLWFETTSAVDDVQCRFTSGRRWDIQAKRRCSWDATFTGVVEQWVAAVRAGDLVDEDRVVLASGDLSGPLKQLGEVFRRLRDEPGSTLLSKEARAYRRFREKASDEGWLDVFDEVVAKALIVELAAETEQDPAFREAAHLLDGTVVARGAGIAALNALKGFSQTEAARAGTSGPERWWQALEDAGIEAGPTSTKVSAGRARALGEYRDVLAGRLDLLEVDHLGVGVPPMPVPGLLDHFRVELPEPEDPNRPDTAPLAHVARRWPRLSIVGLPGSGKSTALEQLAAAWATDRDAPIPVLVRLHHLVGALRDQQYLRMQDVVRLREAVTDDLAPVLEERLRDGTAALLLDGLDECRDQHARAGNLIRWLADEMHPESGLVISARGTASDAAEATGLPVTVLEEPRQLNDRILELVEHVFAALRADASASELTTAREWVKESQGAHADVWRIPLFAVLLAIHAAQTPTDSLPATRAHALEAAINDSVTRWERHKAHEPNAWDPNLHPKLLLDGFADIGHAIVTGDTGVDAAKQTVAQTASTRWGHAAGSADAVASEVLTWWVDRVGVFTRTDNVLRARVKLMGEVGDAMWTTRQTPEDRADWVQRAVTDVKSHKEPALLAAALNPAVAEELIQAANEPDAVLLAADAIHQGATPGDAALEQLVNHLVELSSDPPPLPSDATPTTAAKKILAQVNESQRRYDGPAWPYLLALAKLPLPPPLRPRRDQALDELEGGERRIVAHALAAVADCTRDDREPLNDERALLENVLTLPVPQTERVERPRGLGGAVAVSPSPILSGRAEAATDAIRLIGLTEPTAANAAQLAPEVGANSSERLVEAIDQAGFRDAVTNTYSERGLLSPWLVGEHDHRDDRLILDEAANAPTHAAPRREPIRPWRLTAAAALFEVLEPGEYPMGTSLRAVDQSPDLVRHLVRLAIAATGFPASVVAQDARRALELLDDAPLDTAVMLHMAPDPLRAAAPSVPPITTDDFATLRSCVVSGNDWLFQLGAEWLLNHDTEEAGELLWAALPEMAPRHRRRLAGGLAEATSRSHVYTDWVHGHDPILRLVAARAISTRVPEPETVRGLAAHDDLSIRLETLRGLAEGDHGTLFVEAAAIATEEMPTRWTCTSCGSIELMDVWECTSCSRGRRADLDKEVNRLRGNHRQPPDVASPRR